MSLALLIMIFCILGVIFVNGWTDAPNAIATVVGTRSLSPRAAVLMAAICNLLGAAAVWIMGAKVAFTIQSIADFGQGKSAGAALAAALLSIILWAVLAWRFGIPTSESHALAAGLTGAALAVSGAQAVNPAALGKVAAGLFVSAGMGFLLGMFATRLLERVCRPLPRRGTGIFFKAGQIAAGAMTAFFHGAQDGQKFMGVCVLGLLLARGESPVAPVAAPAGVVLVCALVMGLGTSAGGGRIIKAVGMEMTPLQRSQGFAADLAASLCLLLSTLWGLPVSTTHTKTAAVMGAGAARRMRAVNWRIAGEMAAAWIITFPACGILGYFLSKLFLLLFGR